jgi:hypothetical protein
LHRLSVLLEKKGCEMKLKLLSPVLAVISCSSFVMMEHGIGSSRLVPNPVEFYNHHFTPMF